MTLFRSNCCNASAPSLTNTETGTRAASTTTGHPAPSLAHWITKSKKPSPRLPRVGRGRRHSRNGWQPKCRSEEHTSELQSTNAHLVCRLLLEKQNTNHTSKNHNTE